MPAATALLWGILRVAGMAVSSCLRHQPRIF
nr:MAG TPA: hypothetical protein [Caudoviricetes sp.]